MKRNIDIVSAMMGTDIRAGEIEWFMPFGVYALRQYDQYYTFIKDCITLGIQLPENLKVELPYKEWLVTEVTDEDILAIRQAQKELLAIIDKG